jgi:hypothetical protein
MDAGGFEALLKRWPVPELVLKGGRENAEEGATLLSPIPRADRLTRAHPILEPGDRSVAAPFFVSANSAPSCAILV